MKIAFIHNAYRQRGGEDSVLQAEARLLKTAGHTVVQYLRDNNEISEYRPLQTLTLPLRSVWAWDSYRNLRIFLKKEKPDIAHCHNTFPLISPTAYYACRKTGIPVIQTLHNYRLVCPSATLFRDRHLCEACMGKTIPWNGVANACYRNSYAASAAVASLLGVHRALRTWKTKVNAFIAPSEFTKSKLVEGGLPGWKIFVKPNFVYPNHNGGTGSALNGEYALFIGRLVEEKGLRTMLRAWKLLENQIPLRIAGDGPLRKELEAMASDLPGVHFLGSISHEQVFETIRRARFLVFPSEWYEPFACTIVESFAFGVPVISSRLGAMKQTVQDHYSGLHFSPGDAGDLASKIAWAWAHPEQMSVMGRNAKNEYQTSIRPSATTNCSWIFTTEY